MAKLQAFIGPTDLSTTTREEIGAWKQALLATQSLSNKTIRWWRGSAVPERPEAAQKLALLLAEAGDVDDRLGSSEHGQKAQQQDLVQPIHRLPALPWIRQITEMPQKNH